MTRTRLAFLAGLALLTFPVVAQETLPTAGTALTGRDALQPNAFNPDISAIVDTFYHASDGDEPMAHLKEEIRGFGASHGDHGEGHHHHGLEEGFNLRHLELQFSAAVDPYLKASAIAAIDLDGAEIEVAEVETTGLPGGLTVKAGKFYSGFGYLNAQHAHQWDFTDQPLIYELALGDHGLNDRGAQLTWLAPLPVYVLGGVEAFQGNNEALFAYHGDGDLPEHNGPRVFTGWLKIAPNLPGAHALQFGLSAGRGKHQEERGAHAEDHEEDHAEDHAHEHGALALDGDSTFWGVDFVYKRNAPRPYGQGDFILQGEYFFREKDLHVVGGDEDLLGRAQVDRQDGYYLQAVYGFAPRWRAGARWEQVGLTNENRHPDGDRETYDASGRASAMLDFSPSEFSRLRLQANHGRYETAEGTENVTEVFLQCSISLGAHGAHTF